VGVAEVGVIVGLKVVGVKEGLDVGADEVGTSDGAEVGPEVEVGW